MCRLQPRLSSGLLPALRAVMPRDQRSGHITSSLAHIDPVAAPAIVAVTPDGIQRGESTQTFVAARIEIYCARH